jgi:hypothetical protein
MDEVTYVLLVLGFPAGICLIVVAASALDRWLDGEVEVPRIALKQVEAKIAYKRAYLRLHNDRQPFKGVTGHGYGVDDDSRGWIGFHAYDSLAQALKHPQTGNVYLEVLLSGTIGEYQDGYVASHQRVLQVIPDSCGFCTRKAHYYMDDDTDDELIFACKGHRIAMAAAVVASNAIGAVARKGPALSQPKPIAKLAEEFPDLVARGVVFAELSGPNKLVQTVISKTDDTAV